MSKTLAMKFGLESGDERTISINCPKEDLNSETVTAAMAAMVTHGAALEDPLAGALKATLTERTTTVLLDNE